MKYILTCLGILAVVLLQAQSSNLPEWHFGVKADLNMTNIYGNGMKSGYTAGGQAGGYAERTFNSTWSIQPEILFTQNNSKKGDFATYYPANYNPYASDNIKLAALSIPVMLKYNVTKSFSFLAGPQYSFILVDAESLLISGDGKAFKHSEFSANAGAQYNFGRVAIYGRYNQGISNINNIDTRYPWRSSHIQLGVAVRLN
jgi:hypothetical protein